MSSYTDQFLLGNSATVEAFAASGTQAQGNGTVLSGVTRITVVGTTDDALTLPPAAKDIECILINADSTQNAKLWANSGDRIDSGTLDGFVRLWAGQTWWLKAFDDTDWYTIYKTDGYQASMTALVGGGQVGATLLEAEVTRIATVATNGDSVSLPAAAAGLYRHIYNDDLAQTPDIFPFDGANDRINDQANDTAFSLAINTGITFRAMSSGLWNTWT